MTTKARREDLMIYVAEATDKKINALYTLLEEDVKDASFTLTQAHLDILAQRKADQESGKSKARPWQEVHARISNKRKNAQ